ncbi:MULTISPECIES: hypothetical protein [unclassified Flavobacterium]|uniref:hypothetical protein n=1 Tax=unclassified Flavobacterium TaxID=196869 RepID=UPI0010431FCA|nr:MULTISPECIES: hypothetical protein [unclassified Flavobacterium]
MASISKNKMEENEDANTRKAMKELDALYDKFQVLFVELKKCSDDYEIKKKSTRSIINKSIRKLAPVFL